MQLVECVPNFSEGQNQKVLDAIAESIRSIEGVELLDIDPGRSTNRTVFTFVGEPDPVVEAAFQAIARAAALIDMRKHKGAHPRIGATDVCPFIPVSGITMEECADLARKLAKRVGDELKIPVYLYAEAAADESRRNLADIRQGEYEALADRMRNGFRPDYGPHEFNAEAGATVIGARKFLIAYNVNINSRSQKLANDIALNIREAGRAKRDTEGNIVKDANGVSIKVPGTLTATKAVGWYVEEYQRAQISINLVDYHQTSLHTAFDECCTQASTMGLRVTGSEIVGLVPLEPMLIAGRHYLSRQGRCTGVPESELVTTAVLSLGLSDISPFDPAKKVIEYRIAPDEKLLKDMSVSAFADELSSDSPAPGGGSVAALCGALSAALCSMVANLTFGKKGFEQLNGKMNETAERAQALKKEFLQAIDDDTRAFNKIGAARRLAKDTDENKKLRDLAIERANQEATLVPLSVVEKCSAALDLIEFVADKGNPNTLSDAGVAALTARAAADGAYYNVLINIPSVTDKAFKEDVIKRSNGAIEAIRKRTQSLHDQILKRLQSS